MKSNINIDMKSQYKTITNKKFKTSSSIHLVYIFNPNDSLTWFGLAFACFCFCFEGTRASWSDGGFELVVDSKSSNSSNFKIKKL